MKIIIYIGVLLITVNSLQAQTYYGCDSTQFAGYNAIVYKPANHGPYSTVIEMGPQTEDADNSSCGMCTLFNSETPKLIKAGTYIYPTKPGGGQDTVMVIKIQRKTYTDPVYAQDVDLFTRAVLSSSYGAFIDSTKDANGKYEHIGFLVYERGADAAINYVIYQSGVSFGSAPSVVASHIKRLYLVKPNDIYNFSSYTTGFAQHNGRVIRYYGQSGDYSTQLYDSIGKYSSGATQTLKLYPTLTYDQIADSASSVLGIDSAHNIYRALCGDTGFKAPPLYQIKIKNYFNPGVNYDYGDVGKFVYASDTTGGYVNPAQDTAIFPHPTALRQIFPKKGYTQYFSSNQPGRKGVRVIADITGSIDERDSTHRSFVTDMWFYCLGGTQGDTVFIDDGDTILAQTPHNVIKFIARPDSLMPHLGYIVTGTYGTPNWQILHINGRHRYFVFRAYLTDHGVNGIDAADVGKVIIYASDNPVTPTPIPDTYKGPFPAPLTFENRIGTNIAQGYATGQLAYDKNIRGYGTVNGWDSAGPTHPHITKILSEGYPDINYPWYDSLRSLGKKMMWCIFGSNNYAQAQFAASNAGSLYWGTDTWTPTTDPEDPANYGRVDTLMYYYVARNGTVHVDTSLTPLYSTNIPGNGLNTTAGVEDGNEEDSHNTSVLALFCKSQREYDSYEGQYGNRGLYNADPNFPFYSSPTSSPDTNKIQTLIWLSRLCRNDQKIIWTGFDFHDYLRSTDSLDHAPDCDELVGSTGETPEKDDVLNKHIGIAKNMYKWLHGDTTKRLLNTEYGYGNWGTPSSDPTSACAYPWDAGCSPSIPGGLDSMSKKAILMARSEMIQQFIPIYFSNEFFFSNSSFGPNNMSLFSSYGRTTGRDAVGFKSTVFFPWWYFRAGLVKILTGYLPVTLTIANDTGLCVAKFRSFAHPDSVCYAVWKGTKSGTTLSSQTVNVGPLKSQTVSTAIPSLTVITPTSGSATAVGRALTISTVTETPTFFLMQEAIDPTILIFNPPKVFKSN